MSYLLKLKNKEKSVWMDVYPGPVRGGYRGNIVPGPGIRELGVK